MLLCLRIPHRENAPSKKAQSMNMDIWVVGKFNQLPKKSFLWKNSILCDRFILFVVTLAFDKAVLYGNAMFSIVVLSTKKWHSSFSKNMFCF